MASQKQISTISEAKAQLSALIKFVETTGEDILIGRSGQPVAVLSAYKGDKTPRVLGGAKGQISIADDFDAPLDDASFGFDCSKIEPS